VHLFDILTILEKIKAGDHQPLYNLYDEYRDDFIRWALNNYPCNEEEAKDVFQEVIIRFYNNVINNSLLHLSCDIKTYLWAIGKYQLLNLTKNKKKTVTFSSDELIKDSETTDESMSKKEDENHNKEMVRQHLALLDEKSKKILVLYYLEGKDMKTIAEEMGYKNSDVAKKRKYEVMKKLASLVKDKLKVLLFV